MKHLIDYKSIKRAVLISFGCIAVNIPVHGQNTFPASGNAGIGTTSPTSDLQIENTVGTSCGIFGVSYVTKAALHIDDATFVSGPGFSLNHNILEIIHNTTGCSMSTAPNLAFFVNADDDADLGGTPHNTITVGINKNVAGATLDVGGTINSDGNINSNANINSVGNVSVQGGQINMNVPGDGFNRNINANSANAGLNLTAGPGGASMGMNGGSCSDRPGTIGFVTTGPLLAPVPAPTGPTGYMFYWYGDNGSGSPTWHNLMHIWNDGKVTIGENIDDWWENQFGYTPDGYKLFVSGGILTEKVKVALAGSSNWSDFVFDKKYNLMPLNQVENYINKNKHLPEIPSAEEVVESGIDVATMDAKLLQKIEELTLYVIELKKDNEKMHSEINALKK